MDVSRSGRIRKKSSKLADSFTDEAEIDSPGAASTAGGSKSKAIPATTFNIPGEGEEEHLHLPTNVAHFRELVPNLDLFGLF